MAFIFFTTAYRVAWDLGFVIIISACLNLVSFDVVFVSFVVF